MPDAPCTTPPAPRWRRAPRALFAMLALVLLVAAAAAWIWLGPGPSLTGHTTLAWEAYRGNPKAAEELKSRGARAAPDLGEMLSAHDTLLRRLLWKLQPRLPWNLRRWVIKMVGYPRTVGMREAAARGLALLGTNAAPALPALGRALYDDLGIVRWEAAGALIRIGPGSIPVLVEAIGSTNYRTRHAAAYALGEIGPAARSAHLALIRAGNDTNGEVRSSALYSLGKLGAPPSEPLFELLRSSNEVTRARARWALLGPAATQMAAVTQLLTNAISGTVDERVLAIHALAALNARRKDVVARLQAMAADEREDPRVREAAGQALKRFGI